MHTRPRRSTVFRYFILISLFALLLTLPHGLTRAAESDLPEWVNFFSTNTTFLGQLVPVGALIEAFDPGGVKCGEFTVQTAGQYGLLACFRDDPTTPEDDGADPGDVISFTINGLSAVAVPISLNATPVLPDTPITWTEFGDFWEVDLHVLGADISLIKTADNAAPGLGHNVTFTITVSNAGPDDATNVQVTDVLPAGLTYVSHDGPGSYDPGTGVWTVGSIAKGTSAILLLVARVSAVHVLENTAQVTASDLFDPDSTPGNDDPTEDDQDSVTLIVPPVPLGGYGEPLSALELLAPWIILAAGIAMGVAKICWNVGRFC